MTEKRIRPSVVLTKNGKILVLKSKISSGECYLLPGGGIEGMESIKETAIREAKEETNYDIKIKKLLYLQEHIDKNRGKNVLNVIFLGHIIDGEETHLKDPCLGDGCIQSIEWKTVSELEATTFRPKDILPLLKKGLKNNFKGNPVYLDADIT